MSSSESNENGKRERSEAQEEEGAAAAAAVGESPSAKLIKISTDGDEANDSTTAAAATVESAAAAANDSAAANDHQASGEATAVASKQQPYEPQPPTHAPQAPKPPNLPTGDPTPTAPATAPATPNPPTSSDGPAFVLDRSGGPPPDAVSDPAGSGLGPAPPMAAAPPQQQPPQQQPSQAQPPQQQQQSTHVSDSNQVVEEKGEIPVDIAGRVIGKGGEIIRDLQARSGAQIDVDQSALPGRPRAITYRGSRAKVDFAKKLVQMIASGVSDSNLPIGEAQREVLIIPSSATGKVIGRGGEMVREMQNRSHAKIDFDHGAQVGPDQKRVVVTGTNQAVVKAKEMILFLVANPNMEAMQSINLLVDDKLRGGGQWGSGPPYPNLPNQGINMRPETNDHGGGGGAGGWFPPGGGGGYGGPPGGGGFGGPPGAGGPGFGPPGGSDSGGMGRFQGGGGGPGGSFTDIMYAKKQFMGRIIGSKGATINDLQKKSGTDIQINQDVPPGAECEITIKGTREGVDTAKQMINTVIESGPNHPFAGGGGAAQGGGGGASYGAGGGAAYGGGGGYGAGAAYGGATAAGGYGGGGYDYGQQQQQHSYAGYQQQQPQYGQAVPYEQHGGYQDTAAQIGYGGYPQGGQAPNVQQQVLQHSAGGGLGQMPAYGAAAIQAGGYGGAQSPYGAAQVLPQQHAVQLQPPAPAVPPVLDTGGWKSTTTPDGQTYYWNERTGATQWEKPPGMP